MFTVTKIAEAAVFKVFSDVKNSTCNLIKTLRTFSLYIYIAIIYHIYYRFGLVTNRERFMVFIFYSTLTRFRLFQLLTNHSSKPRYSLTNVQVILVL